MCETGGLTKRLWYISNLQNVKTYSICKTVIVFNVQKPGELRESNVCKIVEIPNMTAKENVLRDRYNTKYKTTDQSQITEKTETRYTLSLISDIKRFNIRLLSYSRF